MKKINLGELIETLRLDTKELADKLFPMHKYPNMALSRVVNGEMLLDSSQIAKLSEFTGLPIEDLFTPSWESVIKGSLIVLVSGPNKAELNIESWETRLFKKDQLIKVINIHTPQMALSEFITRLDYEFSKLS